MPTNFWLALIAAGVILISLNLCSITDELRKLNKHLEQDKTILRK